METPKSPRKKDSTLKKSMNVDNQEDSQDKGNKRKGKKKDSKADKKIQKKPSLKPPTPRNDICSICGLKDTKLYEMKCN
jgi:hypothetical protein